MSESENKEDKFKDLDFKDIVKGFNTSTDYDKLWELIINGYRVPAWLLYSDEYDVPMYDIVEVKRTKYSNYMIGVRGHGYEGWDGTKESFLDTCEAYKLRFVDIDLVI